MIDLEGLKIVKADESDAAEIWRLQRTAYLSEAEIYDDYSIQPLTQTFEQAIEEFGESVVLKAIISDKIIGSVRAHERDNIVYIGKLMVLPDYQNMGVGKKLLEAIEREFQGRRLELFTGAKSEKNIALYEKCGFSLFKTEEIAPGFSFVYMEKSAPC